MTHDRTQPPNDELMGMVVAKMHDWRACRSLWNGRAAFQCEHEPYQIVADPRSDTDAALELIGHMRKRGSFGFSAYLDPDNDFVPCWVQGETIIPISGQPFRTAVCWLAVDVMLGGG